MRLLGGTARDLYKSAKKVLSLSSYVKIWTGYDYPPERKCELVPAVTAATHRTENRHDRGRAVALRGERDVHLAAPRLIHVSLQVNVRGERLPKENDAGMRLLNLSLKVNGTARLGVLWEYLKQCLVFPRRYRCIYIQARMDFLRRWNGRLAKRYI